MSLALVVWFLWIFYWWEFGLIFCFILQLIWYSLLESQKKGIPNAKDMLLGPAYRRKIGRYAKKIWITLEKKNMIEGGKLPQKLLKTIRYVYLNFVFSYVQCLNHTVKYTRRKLVISVFTLLWIYLRKSISWDKFSLLRHLGTWS